MSRVIAALAFAALWGATPIADADEVGLVGQPAPELQTKEWINSDGRTRVADFKGEVLLVEAFATWCGPCRSQMPHLTELVKKYGKKGFNVLSITNESRETVLKYMAQLNTADIGYTIGLKGGHGGFKTQYIPHAWLVGVDGTVLWQGNPGGLSDKAIEAELKKIEKPSDEILEAKASKGIAFAESLVKENDLLQAAEVLDRIAARYKGTEGATKAAARLAELETDQSTATEFAAQQQVAKLVGCAELPKDKVKDKSRKSIASKLEKLIEENQGKNPGAVALAETWRKVMIEDWSAEK